MRPPRLADRLLTWFCAPHLREDVLGDLHERFARRVVRDGAASARRQYWLDMLAYLRPEFIIRPKQPELSLFPYTETYSKPAHTTMIRNYLKIAWRTLLKHKGYSFINIFGLATGMAVAMLIGLWLYDELSFNASFTHYDRIVQAMQHQTSNGKKGTQIAIPIPLEDELRSKYGSSFSHMAMASWQGSRILTYGEKKITRPGNFMGVDMPEILSLPMIKGSRNGLKDNNSILLSESTAKSLFGEVDPMGKIIRLDNKSDVKVTGIYQDLAYNSDFHELTFIAPWELFVATQAWVKRAREERQWGNNSFQLFARLADNADLASVNTRIKDVKLNNVDADEKKYKAEIFMYPMSRWHLYNDWEEGVNIGGYIQYVRLFTIVGIFVLLLACINFMNLSTARSEKRAKEVGIRKAVGSVRSQLISQFFSESFLVVFLAFLGAVMFVLMLLPWFNEVSGKNMDFPWTQAMFWILSLGFIIITGLLAGSYPALYLSSFQPVKVLKGTFKVGRFAAVPRKVLVVVQFTVSVTLIIGTVIVYRQIQHSKNRPIGYNNDGVVMIQMMSQDFYGKYDLLKTELTNAGVITDIAESSSPLTQVWSNNGGFNWPGKKDDVSGEFNTIWVTHDFGKTIGWQFKDGRDFSRQFSTDTSAIVVNEAAVKFMGLEKPIGTVVTWGSGKEASQYRIVGVIKDMVMESPYSPVYQTVYMMDYENVNWIILKLNPAKSATESLAAIESTFKKLIPSAPFDYKFADDEFGKKFTSEERIGKLAGGFAVLAILISCLGLFGLSSFVAEQRTKEIGVRKVLGASVLNLWSLLSRDFVLLVLVAFGIATPIAWYFLDGWLEQYKYRTDLSWWIFALSGIGALLLTLLTVSFQSIKAALINPVKSLKSE